MSAEEEDKKKEPEDNDMRNYLNENVDKVRDIETQVNEIIFDLKTNSIYKDFFGKYNKTSVESFINNYAFQKANLLKYGESYLLNEEKLFLTQKNKAELRLWEIQQKKLFNLQCQWRAGMISLPEIETSYDFKYWEKNIENCPFLDSISEEDFDLYFDYILSENFSDLDWIYSWQDYNKIKDEYYHEEAEVPEWYVFYDTRRNTAKLLELPDSKGEKEKFYLNLWEKKHKKDREEELYTYPKGERDERPDLNVFNPDSVEEFIKKFENSKMIEYFRAYQKTVKNENDLELDQAIDILKGADGQVEIEGSDNWRASILDAAKKYQQKKIAIAHRQTYQNYVYRNMYKIAHETHAEEGEIKWYKEYADLMKNRIIEGRVLNGEPADLNY
ncbi:MAG TPA: hypothetical protein VHP30_00710 [Ignavibacteriales bacterium]|nr:hypothetical protein [Ignavibacteriales bacterium]